ncbi:phytoene synthase [Rhizocola hellebori]|uniref:Phytoene synthase n=1 Tax=Rhizocola hellebori TaxID=1392758 RepID=A0A8J3VMD6_9ACTN|nr:phytoene/squalene synthase family protein [Rhizocola hellebori]GIH11098.1 phytoene synthase [Rhizocola hellebori]
MEPELALSYTRCRELHRKHGRTYYLATKLLPAAKRPHVHALYGFTRYADEIVDSYADLTPRQRASRLSDWSQRFAAGLRGEAVTDPLLPAVLHTIRTFNLDLADFDSFLRSMKMDLEIGLYQDYADLLTYMEGSAAVIGTMMLPILGSADPVAGREPARQLGFAFQLTNFIRDVAEDLDRGRVYLPQRDMALFGVTTADLHRREATPDIKELIRYEIARAREHYAKAALGVPLLDRTSQACIRTAFHLYAGILDEVENADFDVFAKRVRVPTTKRLRVAVSCLLTGAVRA